MVSFFFTIVRLVRALINAALDVNFRALAVLTVILLLSGSVFYVQFEGWPFIDALYFCVMTMTTIGYGDFVPTSNFSKIFTMIYAFTSIGVFVALAARLGGAMVQNTGRKKSKNKDKIKNAGI